MRAEKLAESVLKKYWDGELPVDPRRLAQLMFVRVEPDPDLVMAGLSGMFCYEGEFPTIRYSPSEPEVRQRFTIAHELGHFVLGHDGVLRDPTKNFSATNYDPREVAANRFAAEVLMPQAAIEAAVRSEKDIRKLAEKFNVSEVAMKFRLKQLGWIS